MSETWLSPDIYSAELFPPEYEVLRCDRNFDIMNVARGGGVLLAYKNCYNVEYLDLSQLMNEIPSLNIIGCRCHFVHTSLHIFLLYLPKTPSLNEIDILLTYLTQHFFNANRLLLLGDFNIPQYVLQNNNYRLYTLLCEYCDFLNLQQMNSVLNEEGRLLDLVFANYDCVVQRCEIPLSREDILYHPSLDICFTLNDVRSNFTANPSATQYNFRKAAYPSLYNSLTSVEWKILETCQNIDEACHLFYDLLYTVFDKHVPIYKNRCK